LQKFSPESFKFSGKLKMNQEKISASGFFLVAKAKHGVESLQYNPWFLIVVNDALREARPVRRGVSKGEEDGPRGKKTAHPPNGRNAIWGVACPQGVLGLGMAGRGET
jgi:hypothetical protein